MRGCLVLVLMAAVLAGGCAAALWHYGLDIPFLDDGEPSDTTGAADGEVALATVAVAPDDTIQTCFERNLTPALLLSLYRENTTLSDNTIRACLETQLPSELVGFANPIIGETSQCASEVSQTLTTEEVLILGQEPGTSEPAKDAVIDRVTNDILRCLADTYELPL